MRSGLLALLALILFSAEGYSATIVCLEAYPTSLKHELTEKAKEKLREYYPSGVVPLGKCKEALLQGPIEVGDTDKFLEFYRANHPALTRLYLHSPGGVADEAMNIGKIARKYLLEAHAPEMVEQSAGFLYRNPQVLCSGSDCICASACGLIWFGAVERSGDVGLHRPRIADQSFKDLPPDLASKAYRQVLDHIRQYLTEMEVPASIAEQMLTTDSSAVVWTDSAFSDLQAPPSIHEWISSSCGPFTRVEAHRFTELSMSKETLTRDEAESLGRLRKRYDDRISCSYRVMRRSVDALALP